VITTGVCGRRSRILVHSARAWTLAGGRPGMGTGASAATRRAAAPPDGRRRSEVTSRGWAC
jgi:hypothetical protein